MSVSLSISTKQAAYSLYCDLFSEKTPSAASRKLPSAPSRSGSCLRDASGASGFSQSALRNSGSLSHPGEHRRRSRATAPTHRRCTALTEKGLRMREEGGRSACARVTAERRFASAAERTRADSLCTHSGCYFRPTRRRYRRSSFASLFHACFILWLSRWISPKTRPICDYSPVTEHKRVHPFTDTVCLSPWKIPQSLITTNVISFTVALEIINQRSKII